MKIILLKDVAKLGKKYDVKTVADGFAINSLIPRGLAEIATDKSMKRLEVLKAQDVTEKKIREDLLLKNLNDLKDVVIEIKEKVNDKGHLFAGIHKAELIAEIKKQTRLDMDEGHIIMDKPIKEVGDHMIDVKVGDKSIQFKVTVTAL